MYRFFKNCHLIITVIPTQRVRSRLSCSITHLQALWAHGQASFVGCSGGCWRKQPVVHKSISQTGYSASYSRWCLIEVQKCLLENYCSNYFTSVITFIRSVLKPREPGTRRHLYVIIFRPLEKQHPLFIYISDLSTYIWP